MSVKDNIMELLIVIEVKDNNQVGVNRKVNINVIQDKVNKENVYQDTNEKQTIIIMEGFNFIEDQFLKHFTVVVIDYHCDTN